MYRPSRFRVPKDVSDKLSPLWTEYRFNKGEVLDMAGMVLGLPAKKSSQFAKEMREWVRRNFPAFEGAVDSFVSELERKESLITKTEIFKRVAESKDSVYDKVLSLIILSTVVGNIEKSHVCMKCSLIKKCELGRVIDTLLLSRMGGVGADSISRLISAKPHDRCPISSPLSSNDGFYEVLQKLRENLSFMKSSEEESLESLVKHSLTKLPASSSNLSVIKDNALSVALLLPSENYEAGKNRKLGTGSGSSDGPITDTSSMDSSVSKSSSGGKGVGSEKGREKLFSSANPLVQACLKSYLTAARSSSLGSVFGLALIGEFRKKIRTYVKKSRKLERGSWDSKDVKTQPLLSLSDLVRADPLALASNDRFAQKMADGSLQVRASQSPARNFGTYLLLIDISGSMRSVYMTPVGPLSSGSVASALSIAIIGQCKTMRAPVFLRMFESTCYDIGSASSRNPVEYDRLASLMALSESNGGGTRIGLALLESLRRIQEAQSESKKSSVSSDDRKLYSKADIILITDGMSREEYKENILSLKKTTKSRILVARIVYNWDSSADQDGSAQTKSDRYAWLRGVSDQFSVVDLHDPKSFETLASLFKFR